MNLAPEITVLMPVYNGEKYLHDAIKSILRQSFKNYEFLIINDGSNDKSVEIIKSYDDERIRLVNNHTNIKLIATLNKGIKLAKGEYIARMDCDDVSLPSRLEKQLIFLKKNPEIGVLGTAINIINERGDVYFSKHYPSSHYFLIWSMCFLSPLLIHPSVMMRKNLFKHTHGYDKEMIHAEDYELWYRLSKLTKLSNLSEVLFNLRKHNNNITKIYSSINYNNSRIIRQRIISDILGEDVKLDHNIDKNNIMNIYQSFISKYPLSHDEINLIRKDAALHLLKLFYSKIHYIKDFSLLKTAMNLDKYSMLYLLEKQTVRIYQKVLISIMDRIRNIKTKKN
ncbi:MAG: glycosyltransferase family 2 protein [Smithellaceae bacterium]